ncbi:hypothetical protein GEMRC1_004298 [Eukaryota sp. GEM-RC1]
MLVPVEIEVQTSFGEDVFITGSFSDWSTSEKAIGLQYDSQYRWYGEIVLPSTENFEYKYFIKSHDVCIWEDGPNRRYTKEDTIMDVWESPKQYAPPDSIHRQPPETTAAGIEYSGWESDIEMMNDTEETSESGVSEEVTSELESLPSTSEIYHKFIRETVQQELKEIEQQQIDEAGGYDDEDASMSKDEDVISGPTPDHTFAGERPLEVSPVEQRESPATVRFSIGSRMRSLTDSSSLFMIPCIIVVIIAVLLRMQKPIPLHG